MSDTPKTMVIVGVGPGNGMHIAKEFGSHGYDLVLMARDKDKLASYVDELAADGIKADMQRVDCSDPHSVEKAMDEVLDMHPAIDVLHYNTAMLQPGLPEKLTNSQLLEHFQVDVASALICVQKVLPGMRERNEGALLFTNGGLATKPHKEFTALGMDKAALLNLAGSLTDALSGTNVFVGSLVITGIVKEGTDFDPKIIAEQMWKLFDERKRHELVVWPGRDI